MILSHLTGQHKIFVPGSIFLSKFDTKNVCSPSKCLISLNTDPHEHNDRAEISLHSMPGLRGRQGKWYPSLPSPHFLCKKQCKSKTKGRKCCSFTAKTYGLLKNEIAPQGFEPRFYGPEPHVLPLDEGAKIYTKF